VLADSEFRTANFYHTKGSFPAAANRYQGLADQFPLYSQADESLWQLADSYQHMGDRFENQQVAASRGSSRTTAERACRCRPGQAERNEPARAGSRSRGCRRMKYELENHAKMGPMATSLGLSALALL